jgi:GT2 family glycosyltransferase
MNFLNILIVNWNAGNALSSCIQSVLKSGLARTMYHIFIVDNDSSDNSLEKISGLTSDLTIIRNEGNIGFGSACNIVLKNYSSEFVLLLNPDVTVNETSINDSIRFLENHNEIVALGVKNFNLEGKVVPSCARFPTTCRFLNDIFGLSKVAPKLFIPGTIMSDWDHLDSKEVDHVIGAYMMFRYEDVSRTGFFDEDFFLYMEDVDLSLRIKKNGGKIFYNAEINIVHEGGGTTKGIKDKSLLYSLQSRIIFCRKHFRMYQTRIIALFSSIIEPLIRIFRSLFSLQFKDVITICRVYYSYIKWLLS